jgi:hypothetical protein
MIPPVISFSAATTSAAPAALGDIAAGDLNRDGRDDLVVVNPNNVNVLLATGVGTFGGGTAFAVGGAPGGVTLADLNLDGKLDVATANASTDTFTVRLGTGTGSLGAASSPATGDEPSFIRSADLNRDGKPDLITVNRTGHSVSVMRGNGDGTFVAHADFSAGSANDLPVYLEVGDFNRDGKPDVVTSNDAIAGSGELAMLLGDGTGALAAPTFTPLGNAARQLAVADMNRDGKLDVAVANFNSQNVEVLLGAGNGTFGIPKVLATTAAITGLRSGDFNQDGIPDLIASHAANPGTITALVGSGSGSSTAAVSVGTTSDQPNHLVTGDFNGDGKLDVVTSNLNGNNISILLNNTATPAITPQTITYGAANGFTNGSTKTRFLAVADLNRDGFIDLMTVDDPSPANGNVVVRLGNGGFPFGSQTTFAVGVSPRHLAPGDFNSDGIPDIVVCNMTSGTLSVLTGNGSGSFAVTTVSNATLGLSSPIFAAPADFNRDGKLDLVVISSDSPTGRFLSGNGNGTFASGATFTIGGNASSISVNDLDHDGDLDLVIANLGSNDLTVHLGNGTGGFAPAAGSPLAESGGPHLTSLGDFNNDGDDDLAVPRQSGQAVAIYSGNGTGAFAFGSSFPTTGNAFGSAIADLNLDGKLDLVQVAGSLSTFAGTGAMGFAAPVVKFASGFTAYICVADVNRDGEPDLVGADAIATDMVVFFNTTPLSVPTAATASLSGRIMTDDGRGIRNVAVSLTDENGITRTTLSSTFGYYAFYGIATGKSYTVAVAAKRFSFAQPVQLILLTGDLAEINFTATPPDRKIASTNRAP